MLTVTKELAERIAKVSELVLSDDDSDGPLRQLADLSLELIPGNALQCRPCGLSTDGSWAYAESGDGVASLHEMQMHSGDGPIAETLRFGEARRIDDAAAETRWPEVCQAMTAGGLRSCLVLPLRTDRRRPVPRWRSTAARRIPSAPRFRSRHCPAVRRPGRGWRQGNAALYSNCRKLVANLHVAPESRAVIEQAKGILVAEFGYPPDVAFSRC